MKKIDNQCQAIVCCKTGIDLSVILLALVCILPVHAQNPLSMPSPGDITTIAGRGSGTCSGIPGAPTDQIGDGCSALQAKFHYPRGVATDVVGNIYVADASNNLVRMINPTTGEITVAVGYIPSGGSTGAQGYTGDGYPATSSQVSLYLPTSVTVDGNGNIYISDNFNNVIRVVYMGGAIPNLPNGAVVGNIYTIAGGGSGSCSSPEGTPSDSSGDGCLAIHAKLYRPGGLRVDAVGNLYIADSGTDRIREINAISGKIATIAGNGSAGDANGTATNPAGTLNSPVDMVSDSMGNIYIADWYNHQVRMVYSYGTFPNLPSNPQPGYLYTIAGGSSAGNSGDGQLAKLATMSAPAGLAIDSMGNLYVSDGGSCVIREIFASTGYIYTIAGTGTCGFSGDGGLATSAKIYNQYTLALDLQNNLYVADDLNEAVRAIARRVPSLTITATTLSPAVGQSVTFTCSGTFNTAPIVNGATVFFWLDGVLQTSATTSSGSATWTASSLTIGEHDVSCTSGDSNYNSAEADAYPTVSVADAGTVELDINGSQAAKINYSSSSTPSSIAEALAAAASSSVAYVSAVNDSVYLESNGSGSGDGYPYSLTIASTAGYNPPMFQASPASGTLAGAAAPSGQQTIYSYSITNASNAPGYDSVGNVTNYSESLLTASGSVTNQWGFSYDTLNRLATGATNQAGNSFPNYCWSYDAFGNRLTQMSASGAFSGNQGGAYSCTASGTLGQNEWAQYNGTVNGINNNQMSATPLNANQGQYYDEAGNIENDGIHQYLYDGEGRICAVEYEATPGFKIITGYTYDAEGNRVAKGSLSSLSCNLSSNGFTAQGNETDYILGPSGEQVTEMAQDANGTLNWQRTYAAAAGMLFGTFNPSGQATTAPSLSFRLTDWLGTLRATTDVYGVWQTTCDGLPYGDYVSCSGNVSDPRYYTGKERDAESGNDYFGARYMASGMGRFLTPDDGSDQDASDPQSWNLYAYVRNNPLILTDPDGRGACDDKTSFTTFFNDVFQSYSSQTTPHDCPDVSLTSALADLLFQRGQQALSNATQAVSSAAQQTLHYLAAPRNSSCLYGGTLAGIEAGGTVGAGYGLFGGPAAELTVPAASGVGSLIGGGVAWAAGMNACMTGGGASSGGSTFANKMTRNVGGGSTTAENALKQGEKWLGAGYKEIAPGVYRSADGLRQFRMTTSDLTDAVQGVHVHFESIAPDGRVILENSHVGITNP